MKRAYRAKTKRMRTAVKTAALMSLGIPLATMPAVAQDDEGELTPVVITGSNIPTVELEGPSPIVRIDREEINRSGAETVGELLRRLPQNNAGSYDEKFQNSFAPGTSGISLRGMGMSYTLILVDGRRLGNHSMAQNMTTAFSRPERRPDGGRGACRDSDWTAPRPSTVRTLLPVWSTSSPAITLRAWRSTRATATRPSTTWAPSATRSRAARSVKTVMLGSRWTTCSATRRR